MRLRAMASRLRGGLPRPAGSARGIRGGALYEKEVRILPPSFEDLRKALGFQKPAAQAGGAPDRVAAQREAGTNQARWSDERREELRRAAEQLRVEALAASSPAQIRGANGSWAPRSDRARRAGLEGWPGR
jgi:hypothetical protein